MAGVLRFGHVRLLQSKSVPVSSIKQGCIKIQESNLLMAVGLRIRILDPQFNNADLNSTKIVIFR